MTINRAFTSSLSISSDDGLTGTAIVENDLPLSTRLALTGQMKEAVDRKWIEIECNIISRAAAMHDAKSAGTFRRKEHLHERR